MGNPIFKQAVHTFHGGIKHGGSDIVSEAIAEIARGTEGLLEVTVEVDGENKHYRLYADGPGENQNETRLVLQQQ